MSDADDFAPGIFDGEGAAAVAGVARPSLIGLVRLAKYLFHAEMREDIEQFKIWIGASRKSILTEPVWGWTRSLNSSRKKRLRRLGPVPGQNGKNCRITLSCAKSSNSPTFSAGF